MLSNIREISSTPILFLADKAVPEDIIKALEMGVKHFTFLPIDVQNLIEKINLICEKRYYQYKLEQKQQELKEYISGVDKVAYIYKMNSDKKITFANSKVLTKSKYELEELLNLDFDKFIHPDISREAIEHVWEKVDNGQIWVGNNKFISKENTPFYLKCTVFKREDEDNFEYVTVGFSIDYEYSEKREFKKKVMKLVQDSKKNDYTFKKKILEQHEQLMSFEKQIIRLTQDLEDEKHKTQSRQRQLDHYELQMHNVDEKYHSFMNELGKDREEQRKELNILKHEKLNLKNKTIQQEQEIEATKKELVLLMRGNEEKMKRIEDLNDVIKSLEDKIKEITNPNPS